MSEELKKIDKDGSVYFDDNIENPVLEVECPECNVIVSLYKPTKVTSVDLENGYWRARNYKSSFECPFCLKQTSVKTKKYKPVKLHGHYVLEPSTYRVTENTCIARGRAEDNKYIPDITILRKYEKSGLAFRILRFIKYDKFQEEMIWFMSQNNMSYEQMLFVFMRLLDEIETEKIKFFNLIQRDFEAFEKELGCTVEDCVKVYSKIVDEKLGYHFAEEKTTNGN